MASIDCLCLKLNYREPLPSLHINEEHECLSQMFSYSVSIKKSILSHTSWIQTRACSQQRLLTLIIMRRGARTHLSVHSPLLYLLAHPNSCCHSFPLFLIDPDSKCVWAVQLPLGWAVQYSFCCLRDTKSKRHPKDKEGFLCLTAPHLPCLFRSPSLPLCLSWLSAFSWCFSQENIYQFTFRGAPTLPLLPKLIMLHASPLQTELLKGTNYIIISQSPFPLLVSLSSQTHRHMLQDSRL